MPTRTTTAGRGLGGWGGQHLEATPTSCRALASGDACHCSDPGAHAPCHPVPTGGQGQCRRRSCTLHSTGTHGQVERERGKKWVGLSEPCICYPPPSQARTHAHTHAGTHTCTQTSCAPCNLALTTHATSTCHARTFKAHTRTPKHHSTCLHAHHLAGGGTTATHAQPLTCCLPAPCTR